MFFPYVVSCTKFRKIPKGIEFPQVYSLGSYFFPPKADNMGISPFCIQTPNILKDGMCQKNRSCILSPPSICSTGRCISSSLLHLLPYKEGFPDTWRKPLLISPTQLSGRFRFKIQHISGLARRASLHLTFHPSKTCQETGREENATEILIFFNKKVQRFLDCPDGAQLGNLVPYSPSSCLARLSQSQATQLYFTDFMLFGQDRQSKNTCV